MKKLSLLKCLSILLLQLFSIKSFSQVVNYYVATTGSDNNAGTSLAAPFLTISKALSKATVAGDTIFVRSGTYVAISSGLRGSKSGTAAAPIVLTVYKPDMVNANSRPVVDFSSTAAGTRGFTLSGNYWKIYGFVFKNAGDNGMYISSAYNTIEFCDFTRNHDAGCQLAGGANHNNIINCDSYANADLGTGYTTNGGNADGFAAKLDIGDSIYFRGCRSWLNSDDGYDGYLRPSTGVSWQFEDCLAFRNGYYWLDGTTTSDENGMGFKTGGSDANTSGNKTLAHNTKLIRCLSFNNKGNGFDQNSNAGSIQIYNCTAFSNLGKDIYMTSGSVVYAPGANLVVENTLTFGANGTSLPAATTTGTRPVKLITNSLNKTSSTTNAEVLSFDTTGITAMRKVDGSLPDFIFMHLNTAAPTPYKYIDKGTVVDTIYYHGVLGIPYNGVAPDLGAFETTLGTVPVRTLSFTAVTNTNGVTLNWQVATQVQNKGWYVERANSANSSDWTDVGFVKGAGNSFVTTNYAYTDAGVSAGSYYYRLKQIDLDGNVNYSNVLFVKIDNGNASLEISGYPSPFVSSATVRYTITESAPVSVKVFDLQGRLVSLLVNENEQAGTYQKLINGQALTAGKYILVLTAGNQTVTGSIVKE